MVLSNFYLMVLHSVKHIGKCVSMKSLSIIIMMSCGYVEVIHHVKCLLCVCSESGKGQCLLSFRLRHYIQAGEEKILSNRIYILIL